MEKQISPGLKYTFLAHGIVALAIGLIGLLIPQFWGNLMTLTVLEPEIHRLVGAALLAFATASWLAYRETAWERVSIVVVMEIVWTILGTLVILWGMIFAGLPSRGIINAIIFGGFAAAFSFFYFRR